MTDRDDDRDNLPTLEDMEKFAREVLLVPPVVKLGEDDEDEDEKTTAH